MSTSRSRRYPSVAPGAVLHTAWAATCTGAGAENDVVTALMQGARTITVTAAGATSTIWTFTHKGRSAKYTVLGGDDVTAVALAIKNLINSRWPGELKASVSAGVIKMVVLDRSDEVPVLANSGAGTMTNVLGAKYTVGNTPSTTTVADGIAAAIDAFPDLVADNTGAVMAISSTSDLPGAPTFSVVGTATFGAVTADSAGDGTGWGLQTVIVK